MVTVEEQIRMHMMFFKERGSKHCLVRFDALKQDYERVRCQKYVSIGQTEPIGDTLHPVMWLESREKLLGMTRKQRRKKSWRVSLKVSVLPTFRFPVSEWWSQA